MTTVGLHVVFHDDLELNQLTCYWSWDVGSIPSFMSEKSLYLEPNFSRLFLLEEKDLFWKVDLQQIGIIRVL